MSDVLEVNAQTGEEITRDFTPDELAAREAEAAADAENAAQKAEQEKLATSARLKIAQSSGLSPQEISALGF
jgi:hypothetical protein